MDPKQLIRSAVARVKHTSTRDGREALGLFSLEGTRAVERALRAGVVLAQVLTDETTSRLVSGREYQLLLDLQDAGVELQTLPNEVMRSLTQGRDYGQLIAFAPLPAPAPIPMTGTFVVAVDIVDPGNVGGMIRTSLAAGADGFIAMGDTDPWHPKAVRTSMGSLFKLPIFRFEVDALDRLPAGLKIATSPDTQAIALPDLDAEAPSRYLFMGSEAFGLPENVLQHMDLRVRIPMAAGVDSYSVNVATGIALYAMLYGNR